MDTATAPSRNPAGFDPGHHDIRGRRSRWAAPGPLWLGLLVALVAWAPMPGAAQGVPELFQRVIGSVVVVRAKGRDLLSESSSSVLVKLNEVGSGALVSTDGKLLTAAHVVQIADEINVEFLNGHIISKPGGFEGSASS